MGHTHLPAVEHQTGEAPTASVIWLHGLGADGHDVEPSAAQLRLPAGLPVRFVFPHAPRRPVTLNAGMAIPAWYDLHGLDAGSPEDASGIRRAARWIGELIEQEIERGIVSTRVALAGFSQGGALALWSGLCHPRRLAGILGLSTYLPLRESLTRERSLANAGTPIFLAHGTADTVVSYELGLRTREALLELGYPVDWHSYPMGHEVCPDEITDIRSWLIERLGEEDS